MCSNDNVDERISRIASSPAELTRSPKNSHSSPISLEPKTALFNSTSPSTGNTSLFHQLQQNHSYQQQYNRPPGQASGSVHRHHHQHTSSNMSSILGGNSVVPPGILPPLDHYRLQLYNYAVAERLRCSQYNAAGQLQMCAPGYPSAAAAAAAAAVSAGSNPYAPSRFALSMSFFHNRVFQPEEPKPQHSYIGLIAMAILNSPESKLVLSDIYQHILDNYPYFRTRGPGWRNSIRHNLSLNDCFIKAGRSANGKGHYWAIHPANLEDFKKGDFRRRKAQRKVRKHMGLAVDDEGTDSSSPPPLAVTPPATGRPQQGLVLGASAQSAFCAQSWAAAAAAHAQAQAQAQAVVGQQSLTSSFYSQSSRKRQFDVASLLAPDEDENIIHRTTRSPSLPFVDTPRQNRLFPRSQPTQEPQNQSYLKGSSAKRLSLGVAEYDESENEEDIDVVASDVENNNNNNNNNSDNNQDNAIDSDTSPLLLAYNEDEECTTVGEDLHKDDILDRDVMNQNQQQHQPLQHESQHQRHQSPIADEDNALAEGSNDSNPVARAAAAAAAAASWHGIIQQWPGNFQQHLNNISPGNVNTQMLQRYYGQYMAAAAAQQAAAAAAVAKNQHHHHHHYHQRRNNTIIAETPSGELGSCGGGNPINTRENNQNHQQQSSHQLQQEEQLSPSIQQQHNSGENSPGFQGSGC